MRTDMRSKQTHITEKRETTIMAQIKKYMQTITRIIPLLIVMCISLGCSQEEYAIEDCECAKSASMVKNKSMGLLFYHSERDIKGIDFSGLNDIAFQPKNVFFNVNSNTIHLHKNQFHLPDLVGFVLQANRFNTSVDLLISSKGGQEISTKSDISMGEIIVLTSDILQILEANSFSGLTVDLDNLFNHEKLLYRRLVQELLKQLQLKTNLGLKRLKFIVDDQDLPKTRSQLGADYDLPEHQNTRLMLRLLAQSLAHREIDISLLVRTQKFRDWRPDLVCLTDSEVTKSVRGAILTGHTQYSEQPGNAPASFPLNKVYPLVALTDLQQQLDGFSVDHVSCRESFFNEFIIPTYIGLAFEDPLDHELVPIPLGKLNQLPTMDGKISPMPISTGDETTESDDIGASQSDDTGLPRWDNLSVLAPIPKQTQLEGLRNLLQSTGIVSLVENMDIVEPDFFQGNFICERMICNYQNLILDSVISLLGFVIVFIILSRLSYRLHLIYSRFPVVLYILIIVLLLVVINFLSLCVLESRQTVLRLSLATVVVVPAILLWIKYIDERNAP
jgi:hypothetical protein